MAVPVSGGYSSLRSRACLEPALPAVAEQVLENLCKVYPEPVQMVMREAWQKLRAKEAAVRKVEFPSRAD